MPKNDKNIYFFVKNKYQNVTHVSTFIFHGLFQNILFRSLALIIKSYGLFRFTFYADRTFYLPVPYPIHKNITNIF